MEIGLFQLENLALTPMPFVFFDLRADRAPTHSELEPLLRRAEVIAPERTLQRLAELGVPKTIPVVLVCGDGGRSRASADELERAGFTQIYVVEGGVRGLERELAE